MTIVHTRARYNYPSILAYSFLTLIFSASLTVLPLDLSDRKESFILLPLGMLVMALLGLLTLRMTLWFLNGEESLHLENEELIIRRKGTFWIRKERRIPLSDIKVLGLKRTMIEVNSPSISTHQFSRKKMYILKIQNTGRVLIITKKNKHYKCLDALNLDEAHEIIQKTRRLIEAYERSNKN